MFLRRNAVAAISYHPKLLKGMAGTTGLEPAASAVTGQRSNQLNYVPTQSTLSDSSIFRVIAFTRSAGCGTPNGLGCLQQMFDQREIGVESLSSTSVFRTPTQIPFPISLLCEVLRLIHLRARAGRSFRLRSHAKYLTILRLDGNGHPR